MSIYCSTFGFGDDHKPRCAKLTKIATKSYELDDSKPCTCGDSPIKYQGSHVIPSDKAERGGYLSLGAIPGHIDRPKLKAISDDMTPYHPWLRISVDSGPEDRDPTVILTRKQVTALRDELNRWLGTLKRGAR